MPGEGFFRDPIGPLATILKKSRRLRSQHRQDSPNDLPTHRAHRGEIDRARGARHHMPAWQSQAVANVLVAHGAFEQLLRCGGVVATSFRSHGQRHSRGLVVLALLSRQTVRVARSIIVVRERASSSRRVVVFVATFARHRLAVTTQKFVRRVGVAEERTEGTSSSVLLDRAFLARQSDLLLLLHRYQIADLIVHARVRHTLDDRARQHPRGTRVHRQVFDSRREAAHNVRVDALRGVGVYRHRNLVRSSNLSTCDLLG